MSMTFKRFFTSFSLLLVMLSFSFSVSADMSDSVFGAWMDSAARAAQITIESTLPVTAPVADILINPFNITEGVYSAINYTFPNANLQTPGQTLEAYLQRSHLTIRGDLVTINGVDYRDIWVDNNFAQACRTNVLDLETAWEIASNSSGNIMSGVGFFDGVPLFTYSSNNVRSQNFILGEGINTYSFGDGRVSLFAYNSSQNRVSYYTSNGIGGNTGDTFSKDILPFVYITGTMFGNSVTLRVGDLLTGSDTRASVTSSGVAALYSSAPFSYGWVSQTIPASTLDSSDGIHLYVPADPDDFEDETVQQNIRNFNLNLNNNFSFDDEIDLSTNFSLFNSLIGEISPSINITIPRYGPYGSSPSPTPTPTPVPTAPPVPTPVPTSAPYDQIGTSPWSVLEVWLQTITEYLARIRLLLIDVLDTVRTLPDILSDGFQDVIDAIHDISVNIIDGVEDAQIDFFDAVVDSIGDPFGDIWDAFQSATSIWRYVVSWVGNISAPFSWALSALGSAGSYLLSPFYAVAAAAIVLVLYKRFGK